MNNGARGKRISRRQFLLETAAIGAIGNCAARVQAGWQPATNSSDLSALYGVAGFDPLAPNCAVIAQVSDIHINSDVLFTPTIDDRLVDAINSLNPLPNELVMSGDLAQSHPKTTGSPRNPDDYLLAHEEMISGMVEMNRFDPRMRQWLIPGNHDTDAFEVGPELWMHITGLLPYQRFECAGMPIFLLNGGHSGDFDNVQREWIRSQFESVPASQEIVIFVHHQSLMRIGIERGIKRDLVGMLAGRSGTVWVFSGHIHSFEEKIYTEKGTTFVQTVVTTGNPNAFNDGRNPGFILIGLARGKVACRITRDTKTSQFNLLRSPNPLSASPFIWPFDKVAFPIMALEKTSLAPDEYEVYRKSWDAGTWFSYVGELIFWLPLSAYGGKATEVLILGGVGQPQNVLCGFSASGQTDTWEELPLPGRNADVFQIPIPDHLQGESEILFRVIASGSRFTVDLSIGGWGLGSEPSRLNSIEKWMSQHFKEIRNRNGAAMDACPANDGIPNLWKYAFGLNPKVIDKREFDPAQGPASGGLPVLWRETSGGSSQIGLRFPRRSNAGVPGIRYLLEESDNLETWRENSLIEEHIFDSDGEWEDVALHTRMTNENRRFFRISISRTAMLLD